MERKRRVVILGGGFGGVMTARNLVRDGYKGEIIIIDKNNAHVYTPWLYEVATGFLLDSTRVNLVALKKTSGIQLNDLLKNYSSDAIKFRHKTVVNCDFTSRHVVLADGKTIAYDDLVVAVGAGPNFYSIPGLEANADTLSTLESALSIQKKLSDRIELLGAGKQETIKIVIVGAGHSGTELSAEMANFINRCAKQGILDRSKVRIVLLEAGENILQHEHESVRKYATKRLLHLGVEIETQKMVERVQKDALYVVTVKSKQIREKMNFDVLVWAGGVQVNALAQSLSVKKDRRGRIVVESTLQVKGHADIFALGDVASLIDPRSKRSLPMLAHVAVKEAEIVAQNIVRKQAGRKLSTMRFKKHWSSVIPIGGKNAAVRLPFITLTGTSAYMLRTFVDLLYFSKLLPKRMFLKVWYSSERIFVKND